MQELRAAVESSDSNNIAEELGDSLFALINVGRKLNQDCDQSLASTINKFRSRFLYIEQQLALDGLTPEESSLEQLDKLWNDAKNYE